MGKQHQQFKIMSLVLVFAFIFQITTIAAPLTETTVFASVTTENTLPEVIDQREESVKIFRKESGNYVAAIYGEAVHYQDESGQWQEIDNSLISTTQSVAQLANAGVNIANASTAPIAYHKNVANPFEVHFPDVLQTNTPIMVSYQGETLGFSLQGIKNTGRDTVAQINNLASHKVARTSPFEATRRDSKVIYEQVFTDTQLTYEVRGKKLKESLIFAKPPKQTNFVFHFYYKDLYPELLPSGELHFFSSIEKVGDPIFVVYAPYMFDSGEGYSTNIAVELIETTDGCLYRLLPDMAWLNAEERIYPVTLDPTVTTSLAQTQIHDNCVHESDPTVNFINADRMYVGSVVLSSGVFESRTYIKFPRVTAIPTTALILNATMTLNHHANMSYQSGNNNLIHVYDCGDNAWGTSNITWNTQKDFVFTNRICSRITDMSYSVETFDITSLAVKWYRTTSTNNGLVILPQTVYTNASNRTGYYSSDISSSISNKRPHVTIEYTSVPNTITTPTSGTTYFLRNAETGRYMTLLDGDDVPNQNVHATAFSGSASQRWRLEEYSTGQYLLRSGVGAFQSYLHVSEGNVQIYPLYSEDLTLTLIREGASSLYSIRYGTSYISENSSQNVIASNTDMGLASRWTLEAVFGIVSPVYPAMLNNPVPPKYRLSGYATLSPEAARNLLQTSSVLIFNGHGSAETINTGNGSLTKHMIQYYIPDGDLQGCKFVAYIGCSCGYGGSTGDNIVNMTYDKGAQVVMGFKETMGEIVDDWADGLIQGLSAGKTIRQAMEDADDYAASQWNGNPENLENRTVRGNDLNTVLF